MTVMGLVCVMAAMLITLIADSYRDGYSRALYQTRLRVTLAQMTRELSSAAPASVQVSGDPPGLSFLTVTWAARVDEASPGVLTAVHAPRFNAIQPGQRLLTPAWNGGTSQPPIAAVDTHTNRITTDGVDEQSPLFVWPVDGRVTFVYQDHALRRVVESFDGAGPAGSALLCDELSGFSVTRPSRGQIVLRLAARDPVEGVEYIETASVNVK